MNREGMAQRVALRHRTAALINRTDCLPAVGSRVAHVSVDAEYGIAELVFESGHKLAVHIDLNLGPATDKDAVKTASPSVDMLAAVSRGQLLEAHDFINRRYHNPKAWKSAKRGKAFELVRLRRVPIDLAEDLADIGTAASPFRTSRAAWQAARKFADNIPMAAFPQ